jgi:hypothetical protein
MLDDGSAKLKPRVQRERAKRIKEWEETARESAGEVTVTVTDRKEARHANGVPCDTAARDRKNADYCAALPSRLLLIRRAQTACPGLTRGPHNVVVAC